MAASLRAAAKRMLRPAVHPGEGLRTQHQQHSGTPRALDEGYNHASQIQQKKEELYNLIAKAVAEPTTTWLDRRLLKALSLQIKPRPKDPQWRKIILTKVATHCTYAVGILLAYVRCPRTEDGAKIVRYDGHLVTVESLPMLQGYQPATPAEGVPKQMS